MEDHYTGRRCRRLLCVRDLEDERPGVVRHPPRLRRRPPHARHQVGVGGLQLGKCGSDPNPCGGRDRRIHHVDPVHVVGVIGVDLELRVLLALDVDERRVARDSPTRSSAHRIVQADACLGVDDDHGGTGIGLGRQPDRERPEAGGGQHESVDGEVDIDAR